MPDRAEPRLWGWAAQKGQNGGFHFGLWIKGARAPH